MSQALGTEAASDYLVMELAQAAYKLVREMRPVKPGQQALISADTASDLRVVKATAGQSNRWGECQR